MPSLSASALGLLEELKLKSSLLQLWMTVQDNEVSSIGVILGVIILHSARYYACPFREYLQGLAITQ